MQTKKFQRRIENFVCAKCGNDVKGDGYTDHCPQCLWSQHVDNSPGDRASLCLGMMEPVAVEGTSPVYTIVYKCVHCLHIHRIKMHDRDNIETIINLARTFAHTSVNVKKGNL